MPRTGRATTRTGPGVAWLPVLGSLAWSLSPLRPWARLRPAGNRSRPPADGSILLPGSFPIHDLPDLGITLPEGPYTTVAGLVLDRLGRLPDEGEAVRVDGWQLEVLAVENRAITALRLAPSSGDISSSADQRPDPD